MNIVADTNIFLAVALEEPSKEWIIGITAGCDVHAPEILPYEIGNALSVMVKRRQIKKYDAQIAYEITQEIPVRLSNIDIKKALEIATQKNIYAYDACFLQCAQALSCALITLDNRLKSIAKSMSIRVLE